jgi:hypothetical protein
LWAAGQRGLNVGRDDHRAVIVVPVAIVQPIDFGEKSVNRMSDGHIPVKL